MANPVEIHRVAGGTQVDPDSKGWSPKRNPDEWMIIVPLTDTPNELWQMAWEETVGSLPKHLNEAEWQFRPQAQRVEIWATEGAAEELLNELDAALDAANAHCAELAEEVEGKRAEQSQQRDQVRAEAARLQEQLDGL